MKSIYTILFLFFSISVFAQKWVSPNFDNHHLDYRDLGYPGVTEIPADNSRISALLTGKSGYVYGATSGFESYLFLYDRYINKVRPLGKIPGASGVHHTMVQDTSGYIYIGTGLNLLDEIPLNQEFPGGYRAIEKQLWKDIKSYHSDFSGGKILKYNPEENDEKVFLPEDEAIVQDLGVIIPENSIYALAIDEKNEIIYGITYPDAHFFSFDLKTNKSKDYGTMLDTLVYSGPERTWRSVPRSLICLADGRVLTSGNDGLITMFNPAIEKFEYTNLRIPGEYWESWNYIGYPVVEQLIKDADNIIWGSTSDGFIFRLDLKNNVLQSLGKPRVSRRIRAMTMEKNHHLYFIAGELGEPCKLFSYNTNTNQGFKNYSYLSVDRSPYYAKRAYQFEAMTCGKDGTIFIGESDRRGKLFIFNPGTDIFEGGLNPKNPR
ncbi:MAG: hypothetical protein WD431_25855 [Cyclobacteriaceae bacterium]